KTDLVTIGLGGNDFNLFHDLILTSRGFQNIEQHLAEARLVQPNVEKAIQDIRKRAPHAKIIVVGYLRVFASNGSCGDLPAANLRAQADRIERRINTSLAQAAKSQEATYVDSYDLGNGHDVCAGKEAWVNGSRNALSIAAAYHPFRQGMDAVAREIYQTLKGKKPAHSPSLGNLEAVPR
ncbi:MAG: GDSL-type esterase/lipase family protein, partial [Aeromicrobium sp.]